MVIKLLDLNLPRDFIGRAVLNLDGQISAVIEATELRRWDDSILDSASLRLLGSGPGSRLVQGRRVTSATLTTLSVL